MTPSQFHKQYSQNEISTSSQAQLIVLMYEAAMKFVRQAIDGLDRQDIQAMVTAIQKARDIINELSVSLDPEQGQEAAVRLESLYKFVLSQLTLANIKSDKAALESVLRVLKPLHEAWVKVAEGEGPIEAADVSSVSIKDRI